jgi:hypothetical protein
MSINLALIGLALGRANVAGAALLCCREINGRK